MMPHDLEQILTTAATIIATHPDGELPLPYRRRIWAALGPALRDANNIPYGVGYQRRTVLGIATVRHVLPLWEAAYPERHEPHALLALAVQLRQRATDRTAASQRMDRFWVQVEDLDTTVHGFVPSCVGYAAAMAAATALLDRTLGDNEPDQLDEDRDPDEWDESYYASHAYAGGGPGEEDASIPKRRKFWQWYITRAVPAAYQAVAPDVTQEPLAAG